MPLCLLLCLMLLSPPGATLHRHDSQESKKKAKETPVVSTVDPPSRDFAFDLYRALAMAAPDRNIFFSPLSISMSLAMLSLGARSSTKAQILEGLGLGPQGGSEQGLHHAFHQLLRELAWPRKGLQLSLGNALFISPMVHIRDTFLSSMRTLYLADTFPTNFGDPAGAQKQINDYVAKQTDGKIEDLVKDLDSTEVMVMVNYIFFKGRAPVLEPELSPFCCFCPGPHIYRSESRFSPFWCLSTEGGQQVAEGKTSIFLWCEVISAHLPDISWGYPSPPPALTSASPSRR